MISGVDLGLHIAVASLDNLGYYLHFGLEGLECPLEVWRWYTCHCCCSDCCCYSTPGCYVGTTGMHSHLWADLHLPLLIREEEGRDIGL